MITPEITTPSAAPVEAKLPGPIALFKQAWQIYRSRFWLLIGISVIPMALIIILGLLAGGSVLLGAVLGVKSSPALVGILILLGILVYLAVIYIALWSQTASLFAIKEAEQKIGFKESFSRASHKVFSLLGASLIIGLIFFGLGFVGGVILFVLYAFILPHTPIFFFLEGILGLIFALYIIKLIVEYSLASYIVVGDNTKALSAVQRSQDYIKGNWWKVFWRGLFILVIYVVYFIVSGLIVTALSKIPGVGGIALSQAVNFVFSIIATPLLVVYFYQIYANLRAIKGESQIPADKSSKGIIIAAVVVVVLVVLAALFGAYTLWNAGWSKDSTVHTQMDNFKDY